MTNMFTSCVNKNTDNMIQLALDFVLKLHGNTLINNKKNNKLSCNCSAKLNNVLGTKKKRKLAKTDKIRTATKDMSRDKVRQ